MVFVLKNKERPSFQLRDTVGVSPTKGEVGIEIEVEGRNLIHSNNSLPKGWTYHQDGSLRGEENAEYVLRSPVEFGKVDEMLISLFDKLKANNAAYTLSPRTSVHIHLNVQDFHLNRLASFMALYIVVEEVLVKWCGEHRVGNLFCLRAVDAPGIVTELKNWFASGGKSRLREQLHYSAMNAHALQKFGSLEFRTLGGTTDPTVISRWVNVLRRLYDLSETYKDPRDICSQFSRMGPSEFFSHLLGSECYTLPQDAGMTPDEVNECMYTGVRLAQEICYAVDWPSLKYAELKPDPFGRPGSRTASILATMSADAVMMAAPSGFATQPVGFDTIFPPATHSNPFEVEANEEEHIFEYEPEEDDDF